MALATQVISPHIKQLNYTHAYSALKIFWFAHFLIYPARIFISTSPSKDPDSVRPQRQIPDDLKLGREYALLGNYDTAIVYYDGVCSAMKQQIDKLSGLSKENWQQV